MKTTPWFPGYVKPVRVGVYQRMSSSGLICWSFWNGAYWCLLRASPSAAGLDFGGHSAFQDLIWRGLAEEPKS